MVTFVNNSGIISAFDDSSSPAIETKWLKDNLRVEPYGDYLRLTSVSQNERKAVDYLVTEIVGATSANQIAGVLLGYLEDYGGGGGGSGTVTSVSASVPSPTSPALSVSVTNPTTTPNINISANGSTSQYVRGDGSLANFPASSGGGASISFYLNGSVSQGTFGGISFREMDRIPILGSGTDFTINTNGYIQSFITDAGVPNLLEIPAGNWNFETYFSASSSGGTPSFYVELYKWDGATLTLIASNSANPEGITNGTVTDLYLSALAVPQTTLLATDRLAIRIYVNNSGRTITLHTEDNNLCQVITTFSTGLTALNGLTAQVQQLAVGTSGTDFAISSLTNTHTFNLPTASALNRGALSSADWTTFNAKAPLASPAFTGSPTAPTQLPSDNSTKIATTAYVDNAVVDIDYLLTYSFKSTYNY